MVYLKYVENVIPLSKLIGLLFLFCLPLPSISFLKTKRNDLARPVMGTIFQVIFTRPVVAVFGQAKRVPHWGVQSRFRVIYVIVIPWVVGVYQNKCPCHEGAARVPGHLFRYSPSVTMV